MKHENDKGDLNAATGSTHSTTDASEATTGCEETQPARSPGSAQVPNRVAYQMISDGEEGVILSPHDVAYVMCALEAYPIKGTMTDAIMSVLDRGVEVRMSPLNRGLLFPSEFW